MPDMKTQTPEQCLQSKLVDVVEDEPDHRAQEDEAWEIVRSNDYRIWPKKAPGFSRGDEFGRRPA